MNDVFLEARSIKKTFANRTIFYDIHFLLRSHDGLRIVGKNGTGKSTLAKIIAGVLSPTAGNVQFSVDGTKKDHTRLHEYVGFVAPYVHLYVEFSAYENLDIARKIRGQNIPDNHLSTVLERVNLIDQKDDFVRTYSSGMKQRLNYAFALLHEPLVLILDEPESNLDAEGVEMARGVMKEQLEKGILIVTANEAVDPLFCNQTLDLNAFSEQREKMKR